MRLNEMQDRFAALMLDHPDALKAPEDNFAAQFETGGTPLPERLKIYRNNIVNSMTDALADKLPLCENLVEREFLEGLCRSFALENPPQGGCLNSYGAGLPDFIAGFEPAKSLPYLADMAALELAMNAAYYAPDDTPLTAKQLQAIAPDALGDIRLKPRANIIIMRSRYPLLAIKEFCENDGEGDVDMSAQIEANIMVSRPLFEIQLMPLAPDETAMLEALKANQSLGDAAQAVLNDYPDFDFGAFLMKHIELETFLAFETNS